MPLTRYQQLTKIYSFIVILNAVKNLKILRYAQDDIGQEIVDTRDLALIVCGTDVPETIRAIIFAVLGTACDEGG